MCEDPDTGIWSLVGITSYGARCGDPESPGVYTRVSQYLDFIRETMEDNP